MPVSSSPPQSDTVVEVSIRMSLLVDDLVSATHDQAPIGEFYKAKDTLLREIARLEGDQRRMDYLVARTHITESREFREPIAQMDESGPRLSNGGGDLRSAIDKEQGVFHA